MSWHRAGLSALLLACDCRSKPRRPEHLAALSPSSRDGYLLNRCPKVNSISHPRLHRHACRTSSLIDVPQPVIDPSTWHSVTVSHAFLHNARISRHQPVGWRCSRQRGRPAESCQACPSIASHLRPATTPQANLPYPQYSTSSRRKQKTIEHLPRRPTQGGSTDERETIIPRPRLRPKG